MFAGQVYIVGNAHRGNERKLLVNHRDAEPPRVLGGTQRDGTILNEYGAFEILVDAPQNLDERAFSRSVFPREHMNFAGPNIEIHVGQNADAGKRLANAFHAY